MKSHLIPEPEPRPIDRIIRDTDATRFYLLDQEQSNGNTKASVIDEFRRVPEIPMRNFLRVMFVR